VMHPNYPDQGPYEEMKIGQTLYDEYLTLGGYQSYPELQSSANELDICTETYLLLFIEFLVVNQQWPDWPDIDWHTPHSDSIDREE
jgi:hypothetical protein